jgi:outer membrane protein assembly factor BamB
MRILKIGGSTSQHRIRGARSSIAIGLAAGLLFAGGLTVVQPSSALGATSTTPGPPAYQWPEFHNTPDLQGVSADPTITSSNAHTLGVRWMSPIGGSLASPVAAYSAVVGETLVYIGTSAGYFDAVNAANGQIVWSEPLGTSATSSPLVEGGNVWIAPTGNGRAYKLDAATGAIECSASVSMSILATPVLATPPGGVATVYFASLGGGPTNGHVWAFSEADCSQEWSFNSFNTSGQDSGVWDALSFGVDAHGEGLLLFGSANPDSSVYALDATTGAQVWRYQTYQPTGEDWDVGAGITVSPPGTNGFADGAAYTDGKDGIFYALDLTTGALIWNYNFGGNGPGITPVDTDALTTPALSQTTLVFGANGHEWALNADTGKVLWQYADPGDDINSSAAIVGPQNARVVVFGGLNGVVHVLALHTGNLLYSYQTGSQITSSPADVDGNLLIASEDGFLYDFALGGGNGPAPTTAVTAPAAGATLTNPDGPLTISGTASANSGVAAVDLEVQTPAGTGPWVDVATGSLTPGLAINQAALTSPGAKTTTWSLAVPTVQQGGAYRVLAEAVGKNGIADPAAEIGTANAANVTFTIAADPSGAQITLGTERVAPGTSVSVTGSGFGPSEPVTVTVPISTTTTTTLLTTTTTASGAISAAHITIPAGIPFGATPVTATGGTSGRVATFQAYVSNDSAQLGYGPTRSGFENHDSVLDKHQATTRANMLAPAWTFSAGGAIDSTPAVSQGVAYFGDEAEDVYAVTVTTGTPVWSTSVASAVESSPAVDDDLVIFGTDAGDVVALRTGDGSVDWSTSVGSGVTSAPAVVGGMVYVTSTDGVLAAIDESTGAVQWSQTVAAGPLSSVAVDNASQVVVVGDNRGDVDAFTTAGSPLWSVPTDGPVVATPAISGGDVFVGSTGGEVLGLAEGTGTTIWTATTGGPVTAAVTIAPTYVTVGSMDGDVYTYGLTTGALMATLPIGQAVDGLTSTIGISIANTANGELVLSRAPFGEVETWKFGGASPSYAASGVILNGEYFIAGTNGQFEAFTVPGRPLF